MHWESINISTTAVVIITRWFLEGLQCVPWMTKFWIWSQCVNIHGLLSLTNFKTESKTARRWVCSLFCAGEFVWLILHVLLEWRSLSPRLWNNSRTKSVLIVVSVVTVHLISLSFQLWAATLEKTDGPSLLIHDSAADVTITSLYFSVRRWSMQYQACWHWMGFTFLKGERESLLTRYQGSSREL